MSKSKKTSPIKDHDFREFQQFAEEFKSESDRAAVILGAARLDILLFQTLQRYLVPCATGKDELLEGDSPIGTFSARINLAYRLGLITHEFARSLHLIRRIRNSFAHEFAGISLNTGAHKDRVRELVVPLRSHPTFDWVLERFFGKDPSSGSEFRAAVALLSLRLQGLFEGISSLNSARAQTLVPGNWTDPRKKSEAPEPTPPSGTPLTVT